MNNITVNKSDFTGCCLTNVQHPIKKLQNYTARLETLGRATNRPCRFWKNLFAWAIYRPCAKYSLKGLKSLALQIYIIHLMVTMNRKIKKPPVPLNFQQSQQNNG